MRFLAAALLSILLTMPADAQAKPQLFTLDHPAMGTTYTLYIYAADRAQAEAEAGPVFDEIDRLEELLSNYRPSSELSRINREAYPGPVTTDPETFAFLAAAQHWSEVSHGGFDITVGKLMKGWGFFRHEGRIPSEAELDQLRAETGWQKMVLDAANRTVRFTAPGVELDPGGIGKGFAVDKAVAILREEHVQAAMLSAGSSTIYALGVPPDAPKGEQGWKVVVPDPNHAGEAVSTITLRDTSLSSASCAEKHFILGGHLYCHIMNPAKLRPVEGMLQVTIVDPSATASDALSNVLFVEPVAESRRLLTTLPEDHALVITGEPAADVSSGASTGSACHPMRWRDTIDARRCTLDFNP
ncbi:FAD:protein FMN transferase [Silvibacterium dinghuense]|uniref:FAD:protein FMN transferase n=1 Tax=Silvibacterium dinghuense TaxID=1560006 RepID=A0A4Q1S8R8_9BACT|nr:FAD:protein FMN transferase [Silvibacterium dinghuense]RXS93285.1 FAD:protein FMN transferase [Silvibacterium dinghuense]GGH04562.1 thiamine biosynthesis lipoprotein ApbE [Silvibacterium dinghuense]